MFLVGDDVWATRFEQRDAICLTSPGRRIPIGIERVHDGIMHEGRVYFTTVDGHVVIADPSRCVVQEVIDLNEMNKADVQLGWCRSVAVDGDRIWVGFSRIRPTKFRENVGFVLRGFKRDFGTHVACYDLKQARMRERDPGRAVRDERDLRDLPGRLSHLGLRQAGGEPGPCRVGHRHVRQERRQCAPD